MTPDVGAGFLRGTGALAATVLSLGTWYRRFDWTTGEDERHVARTVDGWNLSLYRYRPARPRTSVPVICAHGMAGSRFIYDLHPDLSLARYLANRGFDTWLVDLRGRGESWPDGGPNRSLQWCFDDFVESDLPASVERVCAITGADQIFWLGMEMSWQALYAASIRGTAGRIRGGISFGPSHRAARGAGSLFGSRCRRILAGRLARRRIRSHNR